MMRRLPWHAALTVAIVCSLVATSRAAEQDEACLNCHVRDATQSRRHLNLAPLMKSVHWGQVSCVECHPSAQQESHQRNKSVTPVRCEGCHDQKSRHGHKAKKSVHCSECHGAHNVYPVSDASSTLHESQLVRTCGRCHPDKAGADSIGASLLRFRVSGHPKADPAHSYSTSNCLACHERELAHEKAEEQTTQGCRRCHRPDATWSRYLGTFHGPGRLSAIQPSRHAGNLLYLGLLAGSLLAFSWGWTRRYLVWAQGRSSRRWDHFLGRFSKCLTGFLVQRNVFARKIAGIGHYMIFLGVAVPILIIVLTQTKAVLGPWPGRFISFLLDLIGLGLLFGLGIALLRRVFRRGDLPESRPVDMAVLGLLFCVVLTGFFTEGLRLAISPTEAPLWSPIGSLLADVLPVSAEATAVVWRIHFLTVIAFVALIPWTRLRHLILAPLNIFFSNFGPLGRFEPVEVNSGEHFGVSRVNDLTWKDLLDTDTCMACGRCQDSCPAYATGKPLSPLKIIQDIKRTTGTPSVSGHGNSEQQDELHARVSPEETWACTTCYACEAACPVSVEHVRKVMGLRRSLVMDRAAMPQEAIRLLRNMEVFGDPGGQGQAMRRQWARGLSARFVDTESEPGLLYWVGCQAVFHPRAQEIARALMIVADRAGIRLALLGERETCCGDPARRIGEEALFQELAQRNIKRFKAHAIKRIVTSCPHCFNTLANEYPDFGADIEVVHTVEWAAGLVKSGRLKIRRSLEKSCALHDPCYFSRVNKLSSFARELGNVVPGLKLLEMSKGREQTFCCGAGGGHMWLHESGTRMNQARAEQCLQTSADVIGTACPYCVTMLEDGVKEAGSGSVEVLDLMEILEMVSRE